MKLPEQALKKIIQNEVCKNRIPGMIVGTVSDAQDDYVSVGYADIDSKKSLEPNTIFRLFSMSKPVCAVAIKILMERGEIAPEDLLSDYIPAFKDMKRWAGDKVVTTKNPIRISHLLSMTAGLTYDDDDNPGKRTGELFREIHTCIDAGKPFTTQMVAEALAKQPLAQEPGTKWRYGLCADVLGAVIERVSKKTLGEFYRDEIFEPLQMSDTGFYVPKEKQHRFAKLYKRAEYEAGWSLQEDNEHHLGLGNFHSKPAFESAGAGLVSTYQDYMRFMKMLVGGGTLEGKRILKRESVESFTQNQMSEELTKSIYFEHMKGYGYGNLMRVRLDNEVADVPSASHSFGWDGWCGPFMSVDLAHQEGILMLTQLAAYSDWNTNARILGEILQ